MPAIPTYECEADVAEGLEGLAWRELKNLFDDRIEKVDLPPREGILRFRYTGNLYQLLKLRTVQAVYLIQHFAIPRPKALLGDQHFKAWVEQMSSVLNLAQPGDYHTLYLSAAGSNSTIMTRLKETLAAKIGLQIGALEGNLLIRLRRPVDGSEGWESLVRLSPRPLATRAWRVCNREGALNATVAYAAAVLTRPTPDDVFLNLLCGSGTLMIERLACGAAKSVIGYDNDPQAVECAQRNIEAAGYTAQVRLNLGDARNLPLPDKSVDVIAADLPFGILVGTHENNLELYPQVLHEAARVARPGARAAFITHEIRLLDTLLADSPDWKIEQVLKILSGGLHPRLFILTRR